MRRWLLGAVVVAVAGCSNPPAAPEGPKGPDVDVEVLAMQSRPMRVVNKPAPKPKVEEVKEETPKPRRKRRRARVKPPVQEKPALPPDETFTPSKPDPKPVVDEPPIDVPADSDDWAGQLTKEFRRREEERKRRGGGEEE